jgi:hypothetical protein
VDCYEVDATAALRIVSPDSQSTTENNVLRSAFFAGPNFILLKGKVACCNLTLVSSIQFASRLKRYGADIDAVW